MVKKKINRKEIIATIETRLQKGISRKKIFKDLSAQYSDIRTIAGLIASIPNAELKEKFKTINNILLGLLILISILKILAGINLLSSTSVFQIPFAFFIPVISIWIAFEVSKYKGYIYKALSLLAIVSILRALGSNGEFGVYALVDTIIALTIAAYAFHLGNKMFPNYGFFGPKKDSDGNAILG